MRDVFGIHDFAPDYSKVRSQAELDFKMGQGTMPGGPSGCGWYRITQPLDALREQGWDTGYYHTTTDDAEDTGRIIVAQRMDKHAALPHWRRWRAKHRLVYEIDDNVFEVDIMNWMAYPSYSKADVRDAVEHCMEVSDMVTVTTEPLAEIARQFNPDVRVIPNCIPDGVLDIERPHQPKVVVGWGGGASHARDIAMIAPTLRHVLTTHRKRAELNIMGTNYLPTVWDCRPEDIRREHGRFTPWVPVSPSLAYYKAVDCDIALAPLTGTLFDQSKSNIKALEAFGLGIPVLASDVEPYRGTVIDGFNGYLCRRKGDWGRRLEELICDDAAREEMGRNARETARAHTMSEGIKLWAAAYGELL
jgi:glycosyltransferase involved in cell wall biosynthesis